MVKSRTAIAALLAASWIQSGAEAGSIRRGQFDLTPRGRGPVSGSSVVGPLDAVLLRYLWNLAKANPPVKVIATRHFQHPPRAIDPPTTWGSHPVSHPGTSGTGPNPGPPIAPVPEPSGVALAVSGVGALILTARRRKAGAGSRPRSAQTGP